MYIILICAFRNDRGNICKKEENVEKDKLLIYNIINIRKDDLKVCRSSFLMLGRYEI